MSEFDAIPLVPLAGSEGYAEAYAWGNVLEARFPDQDGLDFAYACFENDPGPTEEQAITSLVMRQQGERDEAHWIWDLTLEDGSRWVAEGWCDYTGWDCQSDLVWEKVQ